MAWTYGKYCGPGYTGGHLLAQGTSCADQEWPPPSDSLDALCYRHDVRYCSGTPAQMKAADAELLQGLKNLPDDPRKWPSPPKDVQRAASYKLGAATVFEAKITYLNDNERAQLNAAVAQLPAIAAKIGEAHKWVSGFSSSRMRGQRK